MAVAVTSFDNPEVMQVPQGGGHTLFFCSGVVLVNYAGAGDAWRRDDLVFTVPREQPGIGNPPPLPISQLRRLGRDRRPGDHPER